MRWYGETIDDFRVKIPKSLPPYVEHADIEKILAAIENKKTHKATIVRDTLLFKVALNIGLRRGELATLTPADIHNDFLVVRQGKNKKDRVVFLNPELSLRLHNFIKDQAPDERIFGLKHSCITMKIKQFARKAGLETVHAHTLRHKFAEDLLERGANIRAVQELLGHENLSTTQVYLSVTDKHLREAVQLLAKPKAEPLGYEILKGPAQTQEVTLFTDRGLVTMKPPGQ